MAKITKILVVNEPSTRVRVDELSGFSGAEFDVDEYFGNAGALRKASGAAGIGFGTSRDMEDRTSRACAFGWGDSEAQTAPTGGAIARSATDWDIPQESAQTAPTGGAIARSATDWDIPPTGAGRPVMRNGDAIDIDAGPKTDHDSGYLVVGGAQEVNGQQTEIGDEPEDVSPSKRGSMTSKRDPDGTLVMTFEERTMHTAFEVHRSRQAKRDLRARREASMAYFTSTGRVNADQLWEGCRELGDPITFTEAEEVTGFARGNQKTGVALDRKTWYLAMTTQQAAAYSTKVDGRQSGMDFVPDEVLLAQDQFSFGFEAISEEAEEAAQDGAYKPIVDLKRLTGDDLHAAALEIVSEMKRCRKSPPGTGMWAEAKFIIAVSLALSVLLGVLLLLGETVDGSVGRFAPNVIYEALVLFFAELLWEAFLSWLVLRHNVKINYTRKMGHLLRVPKYFFADFVPTYESTAVSIVFSLAVNQILYMFLFATWSRRQSKICDFLFLSQNRKEDRPDTLNYQVTEDLLRFAVYCPFKLVISRDLGKKAIIFIPIIINTIGDGLAEPVGVTWGKHKYRTRSLYADGKFWSGSFVRSYEGSSVVFLVSVITVAAYYNEFDNVSQFAFCLVLMPPLMTLAEAFSPHTNDGPFLAVVGCGILWLAFGLL